MYADHDAFSAVVAPLGPFMRPPEPAEGESIARGAGALSVYPRNEDPMAVTRTGREFR